MPGEGEGLGSLVAGAVAGDNCYGVFAFALVKTEGKFAVGGDDNNSVVNRYHGIRFGLSGYFNNFLRIALSRTFVDG